MNNNKNSFSPFEKSSDSFDIIITEKEPEFISNSKSSKSSENEKITLKEKIPKNPEISNSNSISITQQQIKNLDLYSLYEYSAVCEFYERSFLKINENIRGIHDYMNELSRENLAEYISNKIEKYENLNNLQKLATLQREYDIDYCMGFLPCDNKDHLLKISDKDLHMNRFFINQNEHRKLFSKINSLSRKVLISLALTTEKYSSEKDVQSKFLEFDWEIKFNNLSREELMEFIFEKSDKFNELDNVENLFNLCVKYGYDLQIQTHF